MNTWQARLKHAIEVRAVTKVALAKHVGIKAPSVSAWLSSKSKTMSAEPVSYTHLDVYKRQALFLT